MGAIKVQWVQFRMRGGTPLSRWHAHLVKPFVSLDFAWLLRQNGMWQVHVMLRDLQIRQRACYTCCEPCLPMRHTERWIASAGRWERLLLARGAEDPRGKFDRFAPTAEKYYGKLMLWEFLREHSTDTPTRLGPEPRPKR